MLLANARAIIRFGALQATASRPASSSWTCGGSMASRPTSSSCTCGGSTASRPTSSSWTCGGLANVCADGGMHLSHSEASSSGDSATPRQSRRARQQMARKATEGRLAEARRRNAELELELAKCKQVLGDPQIATRLLAIAPCLAAQAMAAKEGKPSHSSRRLVDNDTHVMSTAARHNFITPFEELSPSQARREQRGKRRKSSMASCPGDSDVRHQVCGDAQVAGQAVVQAGTAEVVSDDCLDALGGGTAKAGDDDVPMRGRWRSRFGHAPAPQANGGCGHCRTPQWAIVKWGCACQRTLGGSGPSPSCIAKDQAALSWWPLPGT